MRICEERVSTYDYVVVGAGSSGCVVANRLTEDPDVSVLLLEAGGRDDLPAIHDPRAFAQLFKTSVDWAYVTAPEPGLNGRAINWPRGKVLGGTSAMNAMIYVRGNRADYDHWASLGNPGWGYEDVLPYFMKSERNSRGASDWHGANGLLDVTDPVAPHPYSLAFVEAASELGHARNPDFNGARQDGGGPLAAHDQGRNTLEHRACFPASGAGTAEPARRDGRRGDTHRISGQASHGCALSAQRDHGGGIGAERSSFVRRHDQLPAAAPVVRHRAGRSFAKPWNSGLGGSARRRPESAGPYHGEIPLLDLRPSCRRPSSNLVEAGLLCSVGSGPIAPELYFHFLPVAMVETQNGKERSALAIVSVVLRPKSRGSLQLQSPDPEAAPVIRAGYYSEREDLLLMIEGLKIARARCANACSWQHCCRGSVTGCGRHR